MLKKPLRLGPFNVDEAGRLQPWDPDSTSRFTFRWKNRAIRARLRGSNLLLQAIAGRVPSTGDMAPAEARERRARSFAAVRAIPKLLPPTFRMWLLADHRVQLESDAQLDRPLTAAFLMTEVTVFALALTPYLELVEEDGLLVETSTGPVETVSALS